MADTNTPNIALLLPDLNDGFSFAAHVEANFTTIDSLMGLVKCTSTTRPSNTYGGQGIFETDTLRVAVNTNTKASPTWTYVSHAALAGTLAARPTTGRTIGELYYETDTTRLIAWNGSAWEQKAFGQFVCTSSTHPANPFQGLEIYETDTGASAVYSGSGYLYPMQQIATQKLGAPAASVTFGSIPAYTSLRLSWHARTTSGNATDNLQLRLNGDSGANYTWQLLTATGAATPIAAAATGATSVLAGGIVGGAGLANSFAGGSVNLDGWSQAGSGHLMPMTAQWASWWGATTAQVGAAAGIYVPSAALTSLTVLPAAGSFATNSVFTLYGMM